LPSVSVVRNFRTTDTDGKDYNTTLAVLATSKPLKKPKANLKNTRLKRFRQSKKTTWRTLNPYRKRLTSKVRKNE